MFTKQKYNYIQTRLTFLVTILKFIILTQCSSKQKVQQDYIFSALPIQVIESDQRLNFPLKMLKVESQKLIVLNFGDQGVGLYNENTQVLNTYNFEKYVYWIDLYQNDKKLLIALYSELQVHEFIYNNNKISLHFIAKVEIKNIQISKFLYLSISKKFFILGFSGEILIYQDNETFDLQFEKRFQINNIKQSISIVSQNEQFFFTGRNQLGVQIYKIVRSSDKDGSRVEAFQLIVELKSSYAINQMILIEEPYLFLYYIDSWKGLFYADLQELSNSSGNVKITEVYFGLGSVNISPVTNCMLLSKQKTQLYLGIRSQGVLIYDLNDIKQNKKPEFYYQIFVDAQVYDLMLSDDENILYFSNSEGLYKYKKNLQQLGNQIPNLFNYHKSKSLLDGSSFYKWRCQISSFQNILYASFDTDMIQRFMIKQNSDIQGSYRLEHIDVIPYESDQIKLDDSTINTITMDQNEEYLIVPVVNEKYGVMKYKISKDDKNIIQPLKLQSLIQIEKTEYKETARISQDNKLVVISSLQSILLINNEKFELVTQFFVPDFMQSCYGVDFTKDSKYVFATARNRGIWIINIENIKQPKIIESIKTRGGEAAKSSLLYDLMYVIDGFNGLIIFNTSTLPKIKILSQIKLQGWANDISLLKSEDYAIISTMDRGMIWLINMADKSNPYLVSSYQFDLQNSQTTCIDPMMEYLFILNTQSVRYFPLMSSVQIHFECSVKNSEEYDYSRRIIKENDFLEVGLSYEIRLIPLYRKINQQLSQVFLYQNQKKLDLPSWIKHEAEQYLEMTVPKEASIPFQNENDQIQDNTFSYLTLIVKSSFSLKEDSFVFNIGSIQTSKSLSKKIYLYLKTSSFLDSQDLLSSLYNPEIPLEFNEFGDEIKDQKNQKEILMLTRDLLQNSIDYNPISWKVKSSLSFDINNQTKQYSINSISDKVGIQFSFNLNQSLIFVEKKYPNVVTFRNEQDTTLSFNSIKESVNAILNQKIIYHKLKNDQNASQNQSDNSTISVEILDGINNNLNTVFNIIDLPFLSLKQDVQIKDHLQHQILKISSDYDFAIETSLFIEFDSNSFFDPDNITLKYQLHMYQNGNYSAIPPQYFLKFDSENLRITGTPQSDVLFEFIHLRLIASNGYTQTHEDFYISIYKVSLMYVLNQLIRILGPLAFFFGIYKKRSYFINAIWKKTTFYSNEFAAVDNLYRKKITLLGNELIIAQLFFSKFCRKNSSKSFGASQQVLAGQSLPNLDSLNHSEKDDNSGIGKNITRNLQIPYQSSFKNVSLDTINASCQQKLVLNKVKRYSQLNNSNNKRLSGIQIKRHQSTPQIDIKPLFAQIKKQNQQQYIDSPLPYSQQNISSITDIKCQSFPLHKKITFKLNEKEEQRAQAARKSLYDQKKRKNLQNDIVYNLCYTNILDNEENQSNNNKISADRLFNKMLTDGIDIQFKNKKIKIQQYVREYQNKHSRFYYSLHACVVNYLLQLDARTLIVYKYIKEYAQQSLNYTINDWYKAYVTVEPTNEFDCNGLPIPFSKIIIKEQSFAQCFSHLQIYDGKASFFNDISDHGINPYLLKDAIFYDSLGLLTFDTKKGYMKYSIGESIHLQQHEILSVEAFKLKQHSRMKCIRKLFNLEYSRMPISKYLSLPSWIQFDCKNGVIMLEGIPTHSDIEDILIRVYNTYQCIVMQFFLKISDESSVDMNNNNNNTQQIKLNLSNENIVDSSQKSFNFLTNNYQSNNNNNQTELSMINKRQKRSVFSISNSPPKQYYQRPSRQFDFDLQQLEQLPSSFFDQSMKQSNPGKVRSTNNKFSIFIPQKNKLNSKQEILLLDEIEQSNMFNQYQTTVNSRKVSKSLSDVSQSQNSSSNPQNATSSSNIDQLDQNSSFTGEFHNQPKPSFFETGNNPFCKQQRKNTL